MTTSTDAVQQRLAALKAATAPVEGYEPVSSAAVRVVRQLLRGKVPEQPCGIFAQADGGLLVEWTTPTRLASLEASPDSLLYLYLRDSTDETVDHIEPTMREARRYINTFIL